MLEVSPSGAETDVRAPDGSDYENGEKGVRYIQSTLLFFYLLEKTVVPLLRQPL
jgi:hypothetical protein